LASFPLLPDRHLPLIPVGWTLIHEVYFYAVFTLLMVLPKRCLPHALLTWTGFDLAMIAVRLLIEPSSPWLEFLGSPLNLEFIFGAALASVAEKRLLVHPAAAIGMGLVFHLGGYLFYVSITGRDVVDKFSRVIIYGIPAVLYVYSLVSLELIGSDGLVGKLKWMGDSSYSTYLGHVLVMSGLGRLWAQFGLPGYLPHPLFLVSCLAASFIVGELSYRYLEKPALLRWTM
jgi:exopolysaccharide production protein ExoZ